MKYHGGSKPGTSRQISPLSFVGDDKVRAYCHASGRNKTFIIRKIEVLDATDHASRDYETAPIPKDPLSLAEALNDQIDRLQFIGWHVGITEEMYSLHRFFKNGKPRKTPIISICFCEFTHDSYYDPELDNLVEEKRKSTRPWVVRCEEGNYASAFKSLSSAAAKFMDFATTRANKV